MGNRKTKTMKKSTIFFLMILIVLLAKPSSMMASGIINFQGNPYEQVGNLFQVPAWLLYSIAKVESNLNPYAINHKGKSYHFKSYQKAYSFLKTVGSNVDVGLGQINCGIWRKTLGVECSDLLNPWLNLSAMGFILRDIVKRMGGKTASFWDVVARYHSSNKARGRRYAWNVYRASKSFFTKKKERK